MSRMSVVCALLLILAAPCLAQGKGKQNVPALDESKIVRHYWLLKNGGVIEISPKSAVDTATMELLQKHCEALSANFTNGIFEPALPAGAAVPASVLQMKKLRAQIDFQASQTDTGWSVRMLTVDPPARDALFEFLRFQIAERKTGDPLTAD